MALQLQETSNTTNALREMDEAKIRRLATVVLDSNDAITIQDFEGRITAWNRGAELMYGYREEEALQMNIGCLTPAEREEEQKDFTRRLIAGEKITSLESQRVTKDGRILEVWLTLTKLIDDTGKPIGIASTERDITERKRAEEYIQTLAKFPAENPSPVMRLDSEGVILYANEASAPILYSWKCAPEKPAPESLRKIVLDVFESKTKRTIEIQVDKKVYLFTLVSFPEGDYVNIYGIDITERKQAEEKQEKLEDQLRQSQKLEAIGQLAGGVAHDFNNLLGGIMGNAELIKMHSGKDPTIARYSDIIANSSAKAADLTRQLLTFARKVRVNFTKVNIHSGIENVIELLVHTIDKRIEIIKNFDAASSFVQGDSNMLENALLNIAINARDVMPDGGTLSFATDNVMLNDVNMPRFAPELISGEYVRVTIRDTGSGMDEKTMLRIFEPFFTTKEVGKGTGLGLAAVYGCVRQHHGHVMVESELGKGSAFIIYLPVLRVNEQQSVPAAQFCVKGKGNILIVDDEAAIGKVAVELLTGIGYTPTYMSSAAEAIEYFKKNHGSVDAVILDIIMPKMNGVDIFRELKRISPGVKVIIASGYSDEKQDALLMEEGVTAFVNKPYMLAELSKALASTIES